MINQEFKRGFILSQLLDLSKLPILLSADGLDIALEIAAKIIELFQTQKKLFICGIDKFQNIARDLVDDFHSGLLMNRPLLPVELFEPPVNNKSLSSSEWDKGKEGDGFLIISGESSKLIEEIIKIAKEKKFYTFVFCGYPPLKTNQPDYLFYIPLLNRPRLEELFLMLGHVICTLVESTLYSDGNSFC
jgi:D-sedoheptulose 7-phosphate isomerase